ncbi:LysR family transcriptional regulator [Actinoplanes sp. LDG1-06]|uniref:LysR family transcriptional regulator n=1 Tax=Paractinoplanes ovalisporus TaxID=2810368 RepID=A0ABS2AP70_9ACTN|nr:LysR family transcriptional regulator [Actinoplanes ovalisporus]MBM2621652.1 LysR family transcriptional regulator [Actinoplanes ovalisporus]
MTLGGTDLNLLLSLKVLLEEGNVTRAGQRLALGQPAMSTALARLRRKFNDELLTRSGREYELTPFAADLLPEVQRAVRLMGRALRVEDEFDPATSERTFRLAMSDYAIAVMHESLLTLVSELAPGVRLSVEPLGPDARTSERVLLNYDTLIAPLGFGFPGESRPLWRDRMVCMADASHPRLRDGKLTLTDLAELPHAVAAFGPGILTPVDRVFGELGIDRRIEVAVAGWLPLPFVLEGTDLVAVLPERQARLHTRQGGPLVQVEPPFGQVILAEGYWFNHDRLADPAHQWLFATLDAVGATLSPDNP